MGMVTLRRRLQSLESRQQATALLRPRLLDEDWLEVFSRLGAKGWFAREPDFPRALEEYRAAIAQAKAEPEPPFDPPADYRPDLDRYERCRSWRWYRFPKVSDGWEWLVAIFTRAMRGVAPVTEVEFQELAAWFEQNADRMSKLCPSPELLDRGHERPTDTTNIRYDLRKGARSREAGELAEVLRQLRARYGDAVG
jgi:hypothetical protein